MTIQPINFINPTLTCELTKQLPREIIFLTLEKLDGKSLIVLRKVSQQWYWLANSIISIQKRKQFAKYQIGPCLQGRKIAQRYTCFVRDHLLHPGLPFEKIPQEIRHFFNYYLGNTFVEKAQDLKASLPFLFVVELGQEDGAIQKKLESLGTSPVNDETYTKLALIQTTQGELHAAMDTISNIQAPVASQRAYIKMMNRGITESCVQEK